MPFLPFLGHSTLVAMDVMRSAFLHHGAYNPEFVRRDAFSHAIEIGADMLAVHNVLELAAGGHAGTIIEMGQVASDCFVDFTLVTAANVPATVDQYLINSEVQPALILAVGTAGLWYENLTANSRGIHRQ